MVGAGRQRSLLLPASPASEILAFTKYLQIHYNSETHSADDRAGSFSALSQITHRVSWWEWRAVPDALIQGNAGPEVVAGSALSSLQRPGFRPHCV